uniref:G-patch domain-containing protein n=1 Tax=Glossina brevipalpis TaxID=37001 RepID=A0A1A9W426_9MUSC
MARDSLAATLSHRVRAKKRRQKCGESDPQQPDSSRERFETEISKMSSRSFNNVGSRLLQKLGWSGGQSLGRKNQARTSIIEELRSHLVTRSHASSSTNPNHR